MSKQTEHYEIAIIGAGIAGIATAYYLVKKYAKSSVVLLDYNQPMAYTSAQSGDNYRNWWPHEVMAGFVGHSIDLMDEIVMQTGGMINMTRAGYALASRSSDLNQFVDGINLNNYPKVRIHTNPHSGSFIQPDRTAGLAGLHGVDILADRQLINRVFPSYSENISHVALIRRAGDFNSQALGQHMLKVFKAHGGRVVSAKVSNIDVQSNYRIETQEGKLTQYLNCELLVNAAGPFVNTISSMLDVKLPVKNIYQQKIAFEDHLQRVPRELPFSIDIDRHTLNWNTEEKDWLMSEPALSWLLKEQQGGIHCRPEGAGRWVKLGWAYNRAQSDPCVDLVNESRRDEMFPEIVMRAASQLQPGLAEYVDTFPGNRIHYGGYYTMTEENWPLIGPLDDKAAYVVGALSGFGSMAACAAGELCADWVCAAELPVYAESLSMQRYQDAELMQSLKHASKGIL